MPESRKNAKRKFANVNPSAAGARSVRGKTGPAGTETTASVLVKECGEKGRGLVEAKDIKMGEQILINKAFVSNDDISIYNYHSLTPDAERLLINQKILKDISLLNHSCAPNAAMGLLDGKENEAVEKRFELRAHMVAERVFWLKKGSRDKLNGFYLI